jgi:hypothetical protein
LILSFSAGDPAIVVLFISQFCSFPRVPSLFRPRLETFAFRLRVSYCAIRAIYHLLLGDSRKGGCRIGDTTLCETESAARDDKLRRIGNILELLRQMPGKSAFLLFQFINKLFKLRKNREGDRGLWSSGIRIDSNLHFFQTAAQMLNPLFNFSRPGKVQTAATFPCCHFAIHVAPLGIPDLIRVENRKF